MKTDIKMEMIYTTPKELEEKIRLGLESLGDQEGFVENLADGEEEEAITLLKHISAYIFMTRELVGLSNLDETTLDLFHHIASLHLHIRMSLKLSILMADLTGNDKKAVKLANILNIAEAKHEIRSQN